ncbi:PorP/SprF family type IX secretion system membrane protein [Algoriphagus sediminis]|uniref:Type IX secretion system membrane protein PorP/SprF n=1 Tax=Algoriphagus sediminis TaxID=3057113 RepID=A0ABT7YH31_9BACT|nr:type IX secretion system membrane protein PorP/SprF [Algoriphagus sediminis]MDN3205823.1 type IX secretion system membrane protein PorP/SprF [Algoriphagus sediminis]
MKRIILSLSFLIFGFPVLVAQDIQYSQFYANPIYLNPAFTGSTGMSRVGFSFRNQWPTLDQSFIAYSAYGDFFSDRYNSGVGLIINGAQESFTQTQLYEIGLSYSYRLRLGESSFLHAGAQGGFLLRDALFDDVILGTQLDINTGQIIGQPGDGFEGDSRLSSSDFHAGLLYYDNKVWFGISAHHLLRPPISYLDVESNTLPIKYSTHGGIRFDLAPGDINDYFNNTDQERSFALSFNYKSQGQFSQLDLGAEFFFEPLILGFWYRGLPTKYSLPNNEAIIAVLGVSLDNGIEVGYSFDFTISKLGQFNSGGAHELSLRYIFTNRNPRNRQRNPMPTFNY